MICIIHGLKTTKYWETLEGAGQAVPTSSAVLSSMPAFLLLLCTPTEAFAALSLAQIKGLCYRTIVSRGF